MLETCHMSLLLRCNNPAGVTTSYQPCDLLGHWRALSLEDMDQKDILHHLTPQTGHLASAANAGDLPSPLWHLAT